MTDDDVWLAFAMLTLTTTRPRAPAPGRALRRPGDDRRRARSAARLDAAILSPDDRRVVDAAARCCTVKPNQNFMGTNWAAFASDLAWQRRFRYAAGSRRHDRRGGTRDRGPTAARCGGGQAGLCARCHRLALFAPRVSRTQWLMRRTYKSWARVGHSPHEERAGDHHDVVRSLIEQPRMPRASRFAWSAASSGDSRRNFMKRSGAAAGTGCGWEWNGTSCRRCGPPSPSGRTAGGLEAFRATWPVVRRGQRVHRPACLFRIDGQRRRVMRLQASVDDQRTGAAPVLLLAEGADAAMSAAGFARVKVIQRKLASDQEAKLLSSTTTRSGKRWSGLVGSIASQRRAIDASGVEVLGAGY